jgi:hypothetical protein
LVIIENYKKINIEKDLKNNSNQSGNFKTYNDKFFNFEKVIGTILGFIIIMYNKRISNPQVLIRW